MNEIKIKSAKEIAIKSVAFSIHQDQEKLMEVVSAIEEYHNQFKIKIADENILHGMIENCCEDCNKNKHSVDHTVNAIMNLIDLYIPAPPVSYHHLTIAFIGSTRFINEISLLAWESEKKGAIVFTPRLLPAGYSEHPETHIAEKEGVKEIIDATYLKKIEMSDEVFVCNIGGYIGDSTRNELLHAYELGKKVSWYQPAHAISHTELLKILGK